ncbi:Ribosomal large subunit pseudouridine synthase D [Candidatus Ornithobacterium hominis]|uniref:Pseudouridine synthase n=1 Tax=Candidatus Ornithobacterium hominis TaxID=2497989 RepID=A0A383U1J4_9FLAO|nr:RluA family pseudouridine synthase [Candidatus Ornithobacterium hominis]MCT7904884.1 RluA family pseudouridine synthase [Candidatus Ornithobacterium hominis]CAI9428940.1 Pseudouridine synthase [Candidatus Ornithobacterium hominis]SZD73390.1 Ribosomal large subunit pseudouridine synthase D [Candidatus Ornithobacterium hominis]
MQEFHERPEEDEDEEELYEHYRFRAEKGQKPLRVDKYLMNFIENASRNKIQQAAKAGNIWVNEEPVKQNYKVKANDIVKVVLSYPPKENQIIPQNIPVNIMYEDESLLLVNKEAGMVVHPGHGNYSGTLVNALKYHFDHLPSIQSELERPGLVHRLDKDTSGLLVIAKTEYAMDYLAKQFFERTTRRKYIALVWGNVESDEGTVKGNIGRNPSNRMQMAVLEEPEGKHAITHYKVLERFGYVTLVECRLETGRTHQIRVHMKHIGHTLFNDERYGGNQILKGTTFNKYKQFVQNCFETCPRQALHAKTLGFQHPVTKEEMKFNSEIPSDMQNLIEKWRGYAQSAIEA